MIHNPKWDKEQKVAKATQVAFELEKRVAKNIQRLAIEAGLTPSSQIRKLIGLPYAPPKRPRLTVSLSLDDYQLLGEKYQLSPAETLEIRRKIMQDLIASLDDLAHTDG
ncbi:MAG: hypothetical protein Q9M22_07320 [Mariprofundaceae bacterium]|nr:hypothetical protein [Mariprofundaceae bacterium]